MTRRVVAGLFHSLDGVVSAPNLFQFDSFDESLGDHLFGSQFPTTRLRLLDHEVTEAENVVTTYGLLGRDMGEPLVTVCGTPVDVSVSNLTAQFDGKTYYFCAADCVAGFEKDPIEFLRTHH